jgi:phosphonate ABC transporter permease subunit PhnE
MSTSKSLLEPTSKSTWAAFLSVFIPGAGQVFLKRRGRGALILLSTVVLAFLVYWSQTDSKIGLVYLGGQAVCWLWLPLILFWVWNIIDARRISVNKPSSPLLLVFFAAIILYVIAWNVTDVKLDRLVTRFDDARKVGVNLLNPDVVTITINGEDKVCAWSCLGEYFNARLAGKTPTGPIRISDNLLEITGKVKEQPVPRWQVNWGLKPEGSKETTFVAGSLIETIASGLMATILSTILAIPLSFIAARNIMSRVRGGTTVYYIVRTLLNIVRAVDTVVWGLIIVVWVGLGTFAGVIALTIHSVAALGKLLSEEIEHIDEGPVEAVTATGANLIQTIRYAVIPQVIPSFLAYSLLRWDINMRSATIIGFVAGGGMGFFVVETTRMGAYQQYATALWAIVVVIILVDTISAKLRARILSDQPPQEANIKAQSRRPTLRQLFYIVTGLVLFIYCWQVTEVNLIDLLQPGSNFGSIIHDFVSIDLSSDVVSVVIQQMLVTIFQGLLATTIGAIAALPFSFLAARNLTGKSPASVWIYYLTRGMFNILRSIEALLYVVIFIAWVGIGPFAGMLALAITSFALIGKLFSEAIENIDPAPIEAVTATGADRLQVISYAILPQIVPPFVSYLIYQWDINIRMATIIGFAGGGGIGLTLTTFFGSLQYHKAGTVVAFIVLVVAIMDFSSAKLREMLV